MDQQNYFIAKNDLYNILVFYHIFNSHKLHFTWLKTLSLWMTWVCTVVVRNGWFYHGLSVFLYAAHYSGLVIFTDTPRSGLPVNMRSGLWRYLQLPQG